jgi:hypothetical protein
MTNLFPPAGAFGWPHIQMQEVLLLVKSDPVKINILRINGDKSHFLRKLIFYFKLDK